MTRMLPKPEVVSLGKDEVLSLRRAPGLTVTCRTGEIWITEDGDLRDTVLRPGERMTLRGGRTGLVSALVDSTVSVQAAPGRRPLAALMARVAQAFHLQSPGSWQSTPQA